MRDVATQIIRAIIGEPGLAKQGHGKRVLWVVAAKRHHVHRCRLDGGVWVGEGIGGDQTNMKTLN